VSTSGVTNPYASPAELALPPKAKTRARSRNVALRAGLTLLLGLVAAGVVTAHLRRSPLEQNLGDTYGAPSWSHPFGTDTLGRDILAWTARGITTGLEVSAGVVILAVLFGVIVGLVAGYCGGVVDGVLMRLVDLQLAIPPLLLFIAASTVIATKLPTLILLLSIFAWVPYARLVRSRVLAERNRAYISAARLAGARLPRILVVHLLPSAATEICVLASLQAGLVLLWESGLSFLGLGLQPSYVSLGFMIAQGRSVLVEAWWIMTFPGIAIVAVVLAFNLIGDGLRDRFRLDVKLLGR
jgi:peptide/nickel transport system permease protein